MQTRFAHDELQDGHGLLPTKFLLAGYEVPE
jgi:hypothetical protein